MTIDRSAYVLSDLVQFTQAAHQRSCDLFVTCPSELRPAREYQGVTAERSPVGEWSCSWPKCSIIIVEKMLSFDLVQTDSCVSLSCASCTYVFSFCVCLCVHGRCSWKGVIPAVGKGGQNCDQVCAGLPSSSEGGRLVKAAAAAVSGSTGRARTSPVTVSCDAGLLPLVNPREPNGESPFCGGAFHPFLLDALASHLPRTGASKLLAQDSSAATSAAVVVRWLEAWCQRYLLAFRPQPQKRLRYANSFWLISHVARHSHARRSRSLGTRQS